VSPATDKRSLFSIILVGLIGNVMEWYDFAVYGYFAGILGQQFFPASDPSVSLIASFGAFAAGFLMRPLGGLLFGRIGDALGRQAAMSLSVLAMAVPTVLMAFIPTYAQIGIAAPILLVLLRIIQGLSVGGEYTSSLIYLAENGPSHRKAFTAIWGSWGAVLGMLLGSAIGLATASLLGTEALEQWGWRIPFAVGGIVALVGWWIRRRLPADVPKAPSKSPIREVLTNYRPHMLRIVLVNIGFGVAYYTVFVYAVTYIRNIDHFTETVALELNTLSMGVLLVALPLAAWVADRFGHRRMVTYSFILLVALAIPLFSAIHSNLPEQVLIAEMIFAVLVAFTSGGMVALNVQLLPDSIRCTGLALAYNVAHGLFGGTTPLVAAWLLKTSDNPIAPAYWLLGALVLSTLTMVFWIRERHLHPLGIQSDE
jgi:MHS family proline/betaine transporter-like MFS transporter